MRPPIWRSRARAQGKGQELARDPRLAPHGQRADCLYFRQTPLALGLAPRCLVCGVVLVGERSFRAVILPDM